MEPYSFADSSQADRIVFGGNSATAGGNWHTWTKPVGKSMASIIVIGGGGGGGVGAIGAANAAASGGGGGSGGMTVLDVPLALLPNVLYVSVGFAKQGNGLASYISAQPNIIANHIFAVANGGTSGGNATSATGGTAGTGAVIATVATMPLGWPFVRVPLAGQAGIIGAVGIGGSLTLPITGLHVTGGASGGGVPASGTGSTGGGFNVPATPSYFAAHTGVAGPTVATLPANNGKSGFHVRDAGLYYYGGTGGSGTNGAATGTGLVQSTGGNGGIGSGGGGGGGALTDSIPAAQSYGGPGLVMITCY